MWGRCCHVHRGLPSWAGRVWKEEEEETDLLRGDLLYRPEPKDREGDCTAGPNWSIGSWYSVARTWGDSARTLAPRGMSSPWRERIQ